MKKTILLVLMLLAFAALQAQFGIKGGINIANWGGDDIEDFGDTKTSLIGPYFGIFYNKKIGGGMVSIQPELVYSSQGVQFEDQSFEVKYITNYLNLTPLLRWNSSGFFLGTGPQVGFLLSAKEKIGDQDEDIKDDLRSTDFSWAFAAGYDLPSGFGIYARFNLGLSSIDDDETDPVDIKHRVFQVGLRYAFMPEKTK